MVGFERGEQAAGGFGRASVVAIERVGPAIAGRALRTLGSGFIPICADGLAAHCGRRAGRARCAARRRSSSQRGHDRPGVHYRRC